MNYVDPSGNFCDNAAERILNLIDEGRIKGKNRSSLEKYLTENATSLTDAEREVADKLGLDVGNGGENGNNTLDGKIKQAEQAQKRQVSYRINMDMVLIQRRQ